MTACAVAFFVWFVSSSCWLLETRSISLYLYSLPSYNYKIKDHACAAVSKHYIIKIEVYFGKGYLCKNQCLQRRGNQSVHGSTQDLLETIFLRSPTRKRLTYHLFFKPCWNQNLSGRWQLKLELSLAVDQSKKLMLGNVPSN